jgi:Tfp pilus assembly protein PilV
VVGVVDGAVMVEASGTMASQVLDEAKTRWRSPVVCCHREGKLSTDCRAWTRPRSATSLMAWSGKLSWRSSR